MVSFIESSFTTKKEYEAACALPPAERDAAFLKATQSLAAPPPRGSGGGLLDASDFFTREGGAPLLRRNAGFLSREGIPEGLRARLDSWPALVGADKPADEVSCAYVQHAA